mmetsp:Transcript_52109/g.161715  ORF Transcript_52109/g.161715 Transcript_52109/m.161715 type:complete len:284 (+) Transcript_52109:48-899(+)
MAASPLMYFRSLWLSFRRQALAAGSCGCRFQRRPQGDEDILHIPRLVPHQLFQHVRDGGHIVNATRLLLRAGSVALLVAGEVGERRDGWQGGRLLVHRGLQALARWPARRHSGAVVDAVVHGRGRSTRQRVDCEDGLVESLGEPADEVDAVLRRVVAEHAVGDVVASQLLRKAGRHGLAGEKHGVAEGPHRLPEAVGGFVLNGLCSIADSTARRVRISHTMHSSLRTEMEMKPFLRAGLVVEVEELLTSSDRHHSGSHARWPRRHEGAEGRWQGAGGEVGRST